MNLGLKEREIDEIKILHYLFPQINQIIIFGSRARGDYNRTSDIDIAITGQIDEIIYKIRDYFEESNLLYTVDVVNYNSITDMEFKKNIDTEGIILNCY
ncbi:nucleotidyltransferase domain-containing protein [uncultured Cetobacterium sp.]|uniref:nucleotidyltransferase family protein n=1 Tax=uncultured Cetobacterium sp. TaxID=527638 RepID=UPI0025D4C062|nr:nucleotidyltransferase domain-containing protein [uncultured Cetobacterium sp.]